MNIKTQITKIGKAKNCLILPKWLVHQTMGKDIKTVGIEKTKEGLEVSKIEGE